MGNGRYRYDTIGRNYSNGRRQDERIAAAIWSALGTACSVVNVGAGTGSYEPGDRLVVAVEPASVMIAQRPARTAPVVRARAETLPFTDHSFDAAMTVLSLHHWADQRRGLLEMRRVSRQRVVVFLRDAESARPWWLYDYFPAVAELVAGRGTRISDVAAVLGALDVVPVPIPANCRDGFEGAYWQRPRAILDPAVWQTASALALTSPQSRAIGMRRLAEDLETGEWERRFGHLLQINELDLGYRVVTGVA